MRKNKMPEEKKLILLEDDKEFKSFVINQFLELREWKGSMTAKSGITGFLGGLIPALLAVTLVLIKG